MSAGQSDRHNQICACQNTTNRVFVPVNDRDRTLISRLVYHIYCFRTKVALIVKLLQTIMRENEEDQNLAGDLLKKCFDEKMLAKESLTKVC
jgi:hypothetical protein